MKTHELRFRISQTQRAQQNALLTAVLVTLFAVVTTAVAPQLLYEYVLQNVSLDQQLIVLRYLPAVSYGAALVVFVGALVKNFLRGRAISMYEQELQLLAYTMGDDCMCCSGGNCGCTCHDGMMVSDSEVEVAPKKTATKSSSSKKSTASKKKTSTKKSK